MKGNPQTVTIGDPTARRSRSRSRPSAALMRAISLDHNVSVITHHAGSGGIWFGRRDFHSQGNGLSNCDTQDYR